MKEQCSRCNAELDFRQYDNSIEMKDSVLSLFGDYMPVCIECAKSFRRLFSAWLDKQTPEYKDINPENLAPWVKDIGDR